MKLRRETYRHIEAEIRDYADTLKAIHDLRRDILLAGRQEQELAVSGGGYATSQTERRASRLVDHILLNEMERVTSAIRRVWEQSSDEERTVIWSKYALTIGNWMPAEGPRRAMEGVNRYDVSHDDLADLCAMSRPTWYRARSRFIHRVAEKLGWW